MFDRQPPEKSADSPECDDSEEEDVLVTFFVKIISSYFSSDGSVASLQEFFLKRHLILDILSFVFIQVHDDPIEERVSADLLHALSPQTLLASFHFLKHFSPNDFYADFLDGFLRALRPASSRYFHDTRLLLLLHLAEFEREAKHRSASLTYFQDASTFYLRRNDAKNDDDDEEEEEGEEGGAIVTFHPSVVAFYHLEALSHYEEHCASTDAAGGAAANSRLRDDAVKALLGLADAASAVASHRLTLFLWVEIKLKLARRFQSQDGGGGKSGSQVRAAKEAAERAFGDDHPLTAKAVSHLADVLTAPRRSPRTSKSTTDSPERLEDPVEKMINDRNVAVSLYMREREIWARLLSGFEASDPSPLNVEQPMALAKAKLAYNQACLKDVVTATATAKEACIAARRALNEFMDDDARGDRLVARLDVVDVRDADKTCRKNFLKVLFVRLAYPERGKRGDVFEWLIPSLRVILGQNAEADGGKDADSSVTSADDDDKGGSILGNKLLAAPLFTRAIVSLASKTPTADFNPKEILRKSVMGLPNSPQWKRTYREFLQHGEEEEEGEERGEVDDDGGVGIPASRALQEAALSAVFATFLEHSVDADQVVSRTKQFIDCWTQLKIFDKRIVERWSMANLDEMQKVIDGEVDRRFGEFSSRLDAAHRRLVLREDDCVDLASDLSVLGCRRELIDGLADRWRRVSGLTSPEKVFCRAVFSEKDLLVVSLNSAAQTTLLALLPFMQRVDPSSPELQGVVVTKRVDVFLRAARQLSPSERVHVRSFPDFASSASSCKVPSPAAATSSSLLPGKSSATSLHDGSSSSSSTYLTDAASSIPEFQSACSSAVDVAETNESNPRRSTHVVVARPNQLRHFDAATLRSLRIVLLDDIAALILPEKESETVRIDRRPVGAADSTPAHVADALDIVKFIAKSEDSQVVAMNHVSHHEYRLDGDSSSFMGTILFQPEIALLPEESRPFGDLNGRHPAAQIFRPFVVVAANRSEKKAILVQLLKKVRFERVLVIAKSCESADDLRDALTTTTARRDVDDGVERTAAGDAEGGGEEEEIRPTAPHPYRVASVDERSSERHRGDELGMFFHRHHKRPEAGVVMVTTENEVDLESTLSNLAGLDLLVVWADWSSPDLSARDLNPDFLGYYVEGTIPAIFFVSPVLAEKIDVEKCVLSRIPAL